MASSLLYRILSLSLSWIKKGALHHLCSVGLSLVITWRWGVTGATISVSVLSLTAYIGHRRNNKATLVYLASSDTLEPDSKALTYLVERSISLCPSLSNPAYIPTFWAAGAWSNLLLFTLKQLFDKSSLRTNKFTREVIKLDDGGVVSIDFADDAHLPSDAPFVIFLHTITGSALETGHYMRHATSRGWRSCVFNRRSHAGVPLTTPTFNVMGDTNDTKEQVRFVRERFPNSYLAMVGVSAGSGLLFSYLGKEGNNTPINVAAALCPAYDIRRAFRLAENYPQADKHILQSMKRLFIKQNEEILCSKSQETYKSCLDSTTVHEFVKAHHPFAGFSSVEEYYQDSNPLEWINKVPPFVRLVYQAQ